MDLKSKKLIAWIVVLIISADAAEKSACPRPESILPCICTIRNNDMQIWCTHSDLQQVTNGVQKVGDYLKKPIDELIVENNYLPSLPGKIFQNVQILRLMLRHNGLERLSAAWLETQEKSLLEIFIVENDLRSLPPESLMKLHNLQAITIQSHNLKRIPLIMNLPKLRYISIQSGSLSVINEHTFDNLPNLERLYIQGSPNLRLLKENALYNIPKLRKLEITNCGINMIHMRAFALLPSLEELSLSNNQITDATIVGRATRDLLELSTLNLNNNLIDKLGEGAFVDHPMLENVYLANNNIDIIHHGAFHRVPRLKIVDLNFNNINRIHPESFLMQSGSGVQELTLIGNQVTHIEDFRALLDSLPRLKFLDMSDNMLQEIPRGALRGHPSLERLHLNKNNIKFIQADAFVAMPALRELHLSNNSLTDFIEGPFWKLPALKGLDLSYNFFRRLQPKLLYNLPGLRRINLSNNQLKMIDPITFMENPLLESVNISGNTLVSIHPATFRNLDNLYELDASSNKLVEFVPGLPRGLEELYLQRNQITNLPAPPSPDLDLPSLRILDVSNNGIQQIPPGCMRNLHNLRKLHMKRNGLRQIDVSTLSDLERLELLDLGNNQIMSVHPSSFKKLAKLKQVNLRGNTMENFDFAVIPENATLSSLDFSKNKLKNINPTAIKRAIDVELFNISSNDLNELPMTMNMLQKLKVLDASHNHIKTFDGNCINNIQTLTEVKMPFNKINELRAGSFENLNDLTTIDLDNNHIELIHSNAIANLPKLISIYLSRNHIVDIPDRVFVHLPKLKILELQGNRIQYISVRAFENIPLIQYLNLSNNQLANLDGSGIRLLLSLEVLDLSFNKITLISGTTFQQMEWLVELNLDNNMICTISGQPFDFMPRLKVLSLKNNKMQSISEPTFAKLRNNIAILDIDGNPLVCNCRLMWLKSWLSESSSIGPKCADGTFVKNLPFSREDCQNARVTEDNSCVTHENQALLPNTAPPQRIITTLEKIKDFQAEIKNKYHDNKIGNLNSNNNNNKPSPEESEYFYDEYVDYPYNDTIIDGMANDTNAEKSNYIIGNTPTLYASMNKTAAANTVKPAKATTKTVVTNGAPGGFTFFGMPIPPVDVSQIWNTGRKIDFSGNKAQQIQKQFEQPPKFETGGFSPVLPTTAGGFMPIPNPTVNMNLTQKIMEDKRDPSIYNSVHQTTMMETTTLPTKSIIQTNTTHKKSKTEIHELVGFLDDENNTHLAYNRTKNVEEQNRDPSQLTHYNLLESNVTITQVTEKEGILITTDTTNDMSLHSWLETSTVPYMPLATSKLPKTKKDSENQPTALSAVLIPSQEELIRRNQSGRPATITKVHLPHVEHYDLRNNYSPVINREGKTRFSEITGGNTKTRQADGKEWYYKNYNNSNIEPYVAPGLHTAENKVNVCVNNLVLISSLLYVVICISEQEL